jgi:hypothetical protein
MPHLAQLGRHEEGEKKGKGKRNEHVCQLATEFLLVSHVAAISSVNPAFTKYPLEAGKAQTK